MRGKTPRFANRAVVVQSWYVALRSERLRPGERVGADLFNRRLVLWRDKAGRPHAFDADCPHLGADLSEGKVAGNVLRCAFHGWCIDARGQSVGRPERRTRSYPVQERWGLVWVFNGAEPTFELPDMPGGPDMSGEGRVWRFRLPRQRIRCHPHLVIGNGLDAVHFETLHGFDLSEEPTFRISDPHRVSLRIRGRPRSKRMRWLTGTTRRDLRATFTAVGGSIAWATVEEPERFHVLFTGRTDPEGACITQTVVFLHRLRPDYVAQAFAAFYMLLVDDHRILDTLRFSRNFTEDDAHMAAFAACIDEMDVW